jgi:hypothetical protein
VVGSIPGNGWDNIRKPMINAGNFAEMVMPVEHWQGTEHIDSGFSRRGRPYRSYPWALAAHRSIFRRISVAWRTSW